MFIRLFNSRFFVIFSFIFAFCSFALLSWAQEGGDKVITKIEVKGNYAIGAEAIVVRMKSRVGSVYSEKIVSQDIKSLYATGFFEDVSITPVPDGDGVKLVVEVKERPSIGKIIIKGNRRIPRKKLQDMLLIKEGEFLDEKKLKDSIKAIEDFYHTKGFNEVRITYSLGPLYSQKRDLIIKIEEGVKERVVKIDIKGNHAFKNGQILKLLETKKASFLNSGSFSEERISEDAERIRDFYINHGYLDVDVSYEVKDGKKPGYKIVEFLIREGKQYRIGSIKIEGNKVIPTEELMGKVKIKVGEPFDPQKVEKDASRIQDRYFEDGYIFAKVIPLPSVDSKSGKIDLAFEVKEGETAYVRKIVIEGNTRTKDKVIRRELRIYPGDKFDGEKLRRSMQRLRNLGYFEDISYDIRDTDRPDYKDLIVKVKEAQTGEFSFGAGYSTVDKFVGFVRVSQNNFDITRWPTFTGGGQKLSVMYERGSDIEDYWLSFTEPWMFDRPISGGFDLYRRSHDRETDVGYGYDEERKGINLRLGKELSEYMRIDGNLKIESVDITDISDDASYALKREQGKNNLRLIGVKLTEDHRDNVFSPKEGYYLSLSFDLAGGLLSGDKDFYRVYGDGRYYMPFLGEDNVLSFRLRVGLEDNYGDSDWVPIYERFFAGGAYSIRGYRERKVSPLDSNTGDPIGGESMLVGNVEYTVPVMEYVKLASFFDFGNVWPELDDFLSGDIYYSVGVGVRVKTPIGPMKLDYGYPLKTEPGKDKKEGRFHFSISRGF